MSSMDQTLMTACPSERVSMYSSPLFPKAMSMGKFVTRRIPSVFR